MTNPKTGLPLATRTFQFTFTLSGLPAEPTNIHVILSQEISGSTRVVDTAEKVDLTPVSTGIYDYRVTPGVSGDCFLRVWTEGDSETVDDEYKVTIPTPRSPATA